MLRVASILFCLYFCLPLSAAELKHHKVDSSGHLLSVWEKSSTQANATILLLHGRTYSSLPDFDLQTAEENLSMMDALVERGFRVFALDARGYGTTERDTSGWLTPDQAAQDAATTIQWITNQTGNKPHLYGWSYGSMVAQLVAQRNPGSVRSIMLFGYPFNPERHVVAEDFVYPDEPSVKQNTKQHAASDFTVVGAISKSGITAYVKAALKADPIRVDFRALHQWAELDPTKVTVPTLLIQGEFDTIAPDEIQYQLFSNLGTSHKWWVVLAGGGHAALLETPRFEMFDSMTTFASQLSTQ